MTTHEGHAHPMTKAGRDWCRKLRLTDRPFVTNHDLYRGYLIQAFDVAGNLLDMDGTPQGDFFCLDEVGDVVWVLNNLRHGVLHDWDNETHEVRRIRRIEVRHLTGGRAEVHNIDAAGNRVSIGWQ
jgi:hypothetical protein